MAYKPPIHGRDHCPDGSDPIPCLVETSDLPWIRLKQLALGQTWAATETATIIYDDIINPYPSVFEVYTEGAENWGVNVLVPGLYQATVRAYFDFGDLPTNGVRLHFYNVDWDIFAPYTVFVDSGAIGFGSVAYAEITFRAQELDKFDDPLQFNVKMQTLGDTTTLYDQGGTYLEVRKLGSALTPLGLDNVVDE